MALLLSKCTPTNYCPYSLPFSNIPTSTPDINFKNNDGGHAEDDQVDELPPEKVSTPMAAAMKSAYSYKRSLHHLGKQSSSSSNNSDDVAFGVVSEPQRSSRTDQEQEVASELSTSSSNSSQNGKRGQASAASIANRLNKLQDYNESDIKGLSRTLSVQTLPMINSPPDRHEQQFAEGRPKTSIGLNGSIPFDEIPIKTRYSSTLSLGQTAQTSPHAYDEVDKQISPFDTNFSQSIAANLNKPEPLRPLQRNATEFIKSPKSFLRRNNRKIFPTKITTSMSQSLTKNAHSPTKIPKMKAYSPPSAAGLSNFERPKEAYATCMSQLEDSNWETVMLGLKNFLRLIRNHPEYIDPHIHVMAGILAKHVRNLRSQVSRAACQATESFFLTHHKQLETEADDLVSTLLLRTADTNKFLRKDATKALESMCDNLTTQKVIHLLSTRGVTHQNALVKTTTSYLLCRVVVNLGAEKVYSLRDDSRDRVFITAATLLTEGSLETRNYAKQVFRILSSHLKYQKVLLEVIPTKLYRHIEKSLKKVEK